jgi:hypothetical protein
MPRRPGNPPWRVAITPRSSDENLEAVRDYLRSRGRFTYVGIEGDGTVEVTVRATSVSVAEDKIRKLLNDMDGVRFMVGHPPL